MNGAVSFSKVKVTNSRETNDKVILLNSLHKYQPQIQIVKIGVDSKDFLVKLASWPITEFIAVTAYQNPDVRDLKVSKNSFAKAHLARQEKIKNRQQMLKCQFCLNMKPTMNDQRLCECRKINNSKATPQNEYKENIQDYNDFNQHQQIRGNSTQHEQSLNVQNHHENQQMPIAHDKSRVTFMKQENIQDFNEHKQNHNQNEQKIQNKFKFSNQYQQIRENTQHEQSLHVQNFHQNQQMPFTHGKVPSPFMKQEMYNPNIWNNGYHPNNYNYPNNSAQEMMYEQYNSMPQSNGYNNIQNPTQSSANFGMARFSTYNANFQANSSNYYANSLQFQSGAAPNDGMPRSQSLMVLEPRNPSFTPAFNTYHYDGNSRSPISTILEPRNNPLALPTLNEIEGLIKNNVFQNNSNDTAKSNNVGMALPMTSTGSSSPILTSASSILTDMPKNPSEPLVNGNYLAQDELEDFTNNNQDLFETFQAAFNEGMTRPHAIQNSLTGFEPRIPTDIPRHPLGPLISGNCLTKDESFPNDDNGDVLRASQSNFHHEVCKYNAGISRSTDIIDSFNPIAVPSVTSTVPELRPPTIIPELSIITKPDGSTIENEDSF